MPREWAEERTPLVVRLKASPADANVRRVLELAGRFLYLRLSKSVQLLLLRAIMAPILDTVISCCVYDLPEGPGVGGWW